MKTALKLLNKESMPQRNLSSSKYKQTKEKKKKK